MHSVPREGTDFQESVTSSNHPCIFWNRLALSGERAWWIIVFSHQPIYFLLCIWRFLASKLEAHLLTVNFFATVNLFSDDKTRLVKICGLQQSFYHLLFVDNGTWGSRNVSIWVVAAWQTVQVTEFQQREDVCANNIQFYFFLLHIVSEYTIFIVKSCYWLLSLSLLFSINVHGGRETSSAMGVYGNVMLFATDITFKHNLKKKSYLPSWVHIFLEV